MIHHVSIEADNPKEVATVLARLMGGRAREEFPFKQACAAFSGDKYGTMIECWPRGKVASIPKSGPGNFETSDSETLQKYQAFHTALSVELDDDEIMDIAHDAGWEPTTMASPIDIRFRGQSGLPGRHSLRSVSSPWPAGECPTRTSTCAPVGATRPPACVG